jgi:pimeloyl-ACP methyl ester carboxylesterase
VVQELALGWPGRALGIVLVSTSGGGPGQLPGDPVAHDLLRRSTTLDAETWSAGLIPALFGPAFRERHAARLERLARWWAAHPQPTAGLARQWQACDSFDRWADLPGLRAPALVIHGTADILVPPGNGQQLAACIPGARLALLEGLGHSPQIEDPAAFNEVLQGFLREIGCA